MIGLDLNEAKLKIAEVSMRKMMTSSHFSICTIDNCCKMLNIHPDKEMYEMLRPLHCVDWSVMGKEVRNIVKLCCMSIFEEEPFDVTGIIPQTKSKSIAQY